MSTPIHSTTGHSPEPDIVGYRTFVAIVAIAYFTIIALTPRASWETVPTSWGQLVVLSTLYLALGIWGFEQVQRQRRFVVSVGYLLLEFAVGMRINSLAWGGMVPLILLPLAAQAVSLLPRVWAGLMCVLVIGGVSGNLSWWPDWPEWLRNIASATAAVAFVVVYSGVAVREREARHRAELLAADVAELAAVNERNRIAREIHDTLGHYLTVIHVQLEAARAVFAADQARGMLAVSRAQALAKDGLTAVRQSVKALREDARVDGLAGVFRFRVFFHGRRFFRGPPPLDDLRHDADGDREHGQERGEPAIGERLPGEAENDHAAPPPCSMRAMSSSGATRLKREPRLSS